MRVGSTLALLLRIWELDVVIILIDYLLIDQRWATTGVMSKVLFCSLGIKL